MLNIDKNLRKGDGRSPIISSGAHGKALSRQGLIHRVLTDESGQILPWAVLLLLMFLGVSALVVDVGHAMLVQRQLQASTDAAALAAAQVLPSSTYTSVALKYSAEAGKKNAYGGISVGTPTVTPLCLKTVSGWGISCTSTSPNAVSVYEQATIPSIFAEFVGVPNLTVGATSTASRGAKPQPFNVAIVLDTTYSMQTKDPNCGNKTQLACAENAIAIILNGLAPTQDKVSLFTFPAMEVGSASNDTNCSGNQATGEPYTFPSTSATSLQTMPITTGSGRNSSTVQTTYQITGYLTDYRTSDAAKSLSNGSLLTKGIGSDTGCSGLQVNSTQNTYFASTIYQAQASLLAEQAANPGTMNAIIFLSDGNATAVDNTVWTDLASGSTATSNCPNGQTCVGVNNSNNGIYPNLQGQCGQAVDAANAASNAGTIFYTIAYGSPSTSLAANNYPALNNGNCTSDIGTGQHPGITPCQDMQDMSTGWTASTQDTSHFYSDYYAPGGDSGCQAAGPNNTITALSDIASAIVGQFTGVRLIPSNTP